MDESQSRIRVLIVDDHVIVRQGLRTLLELMEDIEIAGEAATGSAAVRLAQALRPDVVLMDLKMPEMDGIEATKAICESGLGSRIIALTSFWDDEALIPAIQAGATSFLLKDVAPTDLVDAIRAANRGEARLHPRVARRLMEQVAQPPAEPDAAPPDITERELEVLQLIARGMSNRDIAAELVVSEKTVKTHVSSLLSKLNLNDRTQLAIYALKHDLAGDPD